MRLGPQDAYLLNHPDYIRDVLVTNQRLFTKSRIMQRSKVLLGEGLLTSEGDFHLRQRRLVQPAFHRERLEAYAAVMAGLATSAGDRWRPGEELRIDQEMMRLTLSIAGRALFNADVADEAGEIGRALTDIFGMFNRLTLPFATLLLRLPLPSSRRFERARARLDETVYRIIRERRASGVDAGDLLSMLLLASDEDGSVGMTDQQVRDEVLTLFIAGHETTAVALTWTWYLLSLNPECERKLHDELERVLGGRTPSLADLPDLRYTEMVLAESMRLYPPAWAISRLAQANYEAGGVPIPAGSVCLMSQYVTHRDERFFPDPERFEPERFVPELREARPRFAYFPFGGGTRVCIGERFAWMEGVLVLAAIAQKWKFRLVPGHPVVPLPVITLRTKHGIRMSAEQR